MKVPKLLLGAILLGITVETNSSCNKKNHEVTPTNPTEQANNNPNNPQPTDPCLACGLG